MPLDPQIRKDVIAILGVVLGNLPPDDRVTFLNARLDGLDLLTHNDCRGDKLTVASHVAQRLYEHGLMPDHKPALEVLLSSLLEEGRIGNQWKKSVEGYLKRPGSLYGGGGDAESTRIPEQPQKESLPAPPSPNPPQPRTAAKRNVMASKKKPAIPDESEPPPAAAAPAADAATTPQAATTAGNATDSDAATMESAQPVEEVILLIPGIRTDAFWQQRVQLALSDPRFLIKPLMYPGFVDLFSFWWPPKRRKFIERVDKDIDNATKQHPGLKLSIIAHSFGTYAVGEALKNQPYLRLHRLVLCGSVLPQSFDWALYSQHVFTDVINDCGSRDWYPILAKSLSWGYGPAGVFGFGAPVEDRFHDIGHSGFFENDFPATYWKPWFHENRKVYSDWHWNRRPTSYIRYLIAITDLKLVIGLVLGLGVWIWWQFGWKGLLVGLGCLAILPLAALAIFAVVRFPKRSIAAALVSLLMFVVWQVFLRDKPQPPPMPPQPDVLESVPILRPSAPDSGAKIVVTSKFDSQGDLLITVGGLDSLPQSNREFAILGTVEGKAESVLKSPLRATDPTAVTSINLTSLLKVAPKTLACRVTWLSDGQTKSVSIPVDDKPGELPPDFEKLTPAGLTRWLEEISEARLGWLMKETQAANKISAHVAVLSLDLTGLGSSKIDPDKLPILFDSMTVQDLRTMILGSWQTVPAYRNFNYDLLETDIDQFIEDYEGYANQTMKGAFGALQRKMNQTPSDAAKKKKR